MLTTIDKKEQEKLEHVTCLPQKITSYRVESWRWFLVSIVLSLVLLCCVFIIHIQFSRIDKRTELLVVKMYPNGTWQSVKKDFESPTEFFPATIDHLLTRYVETRYGQIPETIKTDYGEATVFMSPEIENIFKSDEPGGFNAPQRAADIIEKPESADRINVKMTIPPDHYEDLTGHFIDGERHVIRTNMYFILETLHPDGNKNIKSKILRLQWTLLPKKELKNKARDWIILNPLGLQIIKEELIDDPSFKPK